MWESVCCVMHLIPLGLDVLLAYTGRSMELLSNRFDRWTVGPTIKPVVLCGKRSCSVTSLTVSLKERIKRKQLDQRWRPNLESGSYRIATVWLSFRCFTWVCILACLTGGLLVYFRFSMYALAAGVFSLLERKHDILMYYYYTRAFFV